MRRCNIFFEKNGTIKPSILFLFIFIFINLFVPNFPLLFFLLNSLLFLRIYSYFSRKNNKLTVEDSVNCGASEWSIENRKVGLRYLNKITKEAQQELYLKGLLANGTAPNAPKLWEGSVNMNSSTISDGEKNNENSKWGNNLNNHGTNKGGSNLLKNSLTLRNSKDDMNLSSYLASPTQLMIHWGALKGDAVSFFSLEFAGPTGTTTRYLKYKEIFRDPEDAGPDSVFKYSRLIEGLLPGTSYAFRVRSFNGFGPGEYTYKVFTTRPAAPSCPVILMISSESVKLRWLFSLSFFKHINELKNLFINADIDNSGAVNREELTGILNDENSHSKELKIFLTKIAMKIGLDVGQGYGALFDMIEGDDDGTLTWKEFESFFMSAGWASNDSIVPSVRDSVTSLNSSISHIDKSKKLLEQQLAGLTYVVEKCQNEFLDDYEEVLRTNAGQGIIHRLEPGVSYRFRVYAINVDNIRGPPSESIVTHTMLETPSAPMVVLKNIGSRKVSMTWKKREQTGSSVRDKATIQKMLGDWAGSHGEDDGGVSIETAFARYDIDRSGTIDIHELELLLKDLGVEPTEERIREAFLLLDADKNGVITFEEFGVWWRRDEVSYTIKRSDAILPEYVPDDRGDIRSSTVNISLQRDQSKQMLRTGSGAGVGVAARPRSALRGVRESKDTENDNYSTHTSQSKGQGSVTSNRSKSAGRMRPNTSSISGHVNDTTAGGAGAGGVAGVTSAEKRKMDKQVAMPIVCHRGPGSKCEIAGLEPNRL